MLVGRAAETAALDRIVEDARAGRGSALVVHGEAGVGKSALIGHLRRSSVGFLVLESVGIESEAELAFAGLHQLLHPVLDHLEDLPGPQAAALRAAFGLSDDSVAEQFRISLAVLGLLTAAAEKQPVLCLVDDAQWLDEASLAAVQFAARRIAADGIGIVLAARDSAGHSVVGGGLPELTVRALSEDDARELALDGLGADASPEALSWVLANAGGNPLALLELPQALSPAHRFGREPLAGVLPPTTAVEREYLQRVGRLDHRVQQALLVAAAEESQDRATIAAACAGIGVAPALLSVAERHGLIDVSLERVTFRHPLVRSAVYRGAGYADRERVHRALAAVLTAAADADRRAWHLAMATAGPDDEVAGALEDTAERAARRAGYAGATAALARAADLSGSPADRARRTVRAARAAWQAGQRTRAVALLDAAEVPAAEPLLRAERDRVRGLIEIGRGSLLTAGSVLLTGIDAAAGHAPELALEMLSDAGLAAGRSGNFVLMAEVCRRAQLLPPLSDVDELLRDLLIGVGSFTSATTTAELPRLQSAVERAQSSSDFRVLGWAAFGAGAIGRAGLEEALARSRTAVRAFGAVPAVVILLETDVVASLLGGRYSFAAEAEEGLRLATEVGLDNSALAFRAALAWLAGLHGDEPACRQYADEVTAAGDHHMAMAYSVAQWSVALLELADGAAGAAAARLSALSAAPTGRHHPFFALMATPTLVEALVVSGGKTEAHRAAEPLLALATDGTPLWLRGLAARCTALLGGGEAEAAFADSVRLLAEAGRSFDLARSQLAFGQFLRRQRRRADAREHLRAAIDGFDRLDARPWAERARIELRATGETARRRDPSTLTRLTPQERQIAQLVSGGNSNKDVATQLFLSPRTVEYHLAKVFTKLGISSRAELIRQGEALLAPA